MQPYVKANCEPHKDAATFPSKFGANVSILITPSAAHMHSQPRAFKATDTVFIRL